SESGCRRRIGRRHEGLSGTYSLSAGDLLSVSHSYSSKVSAAELMQYRRPLGPGPSGNTWPRWAPQEAQRTSGRRMPQLVSSCVVMRPGSATPEKLGQAQSECNLTVDSNSPVPQTTQS